MFLKYADAISTSELAVSSSLQNRFYVSQTSPVMQPVQQLLAEIAPTDIPVLLVGESGTGKEIAALEIHRLSKYRHLPFLKLSCAAFTLESFQTHLRGFENGNGDQDGKGAGTFFFDEVSELDASCQRHLLHSFPDGTGLAANRALACRIISCTTLDLESEVRNGRFRSELFYRLKGVCVRLPPLRGRKEDIPLLVQFFLQKYARLHGRALMTPSEQALRLLTEYSWPGNIRELENVVKKIVALGSEELAIADLVERPATGRLPGARPMGCSLKAASRAASQQAERELILQALARTHWNRKRAAEALQISYKSFLSKLKQIQAPDSEGV